MKLTIAQICELVGGTASGDPTLEVSGLAPAETAGPGDLTFAESREYLDLALRSRAAAVLTSHGLAVQSGQKVIIRVSNPRVAFARLMERFHPEPIPAPGIHSTAVVDPTAQVDPAAYVGPYCVIGAGAWVGAGAVLFAHVWVGENSRIGEQTRIFPNVSIYPGTRVGRRVRIHSGTVIGSDGFGYVFDNGVHRKIPQVGWVEIGDDVEIGANVTIDRGALGPTVIGAGTKIDNLVQIAHNVRVGEHCLIVAQVGIAGSTRIGDYTTLAGQVGIAGHLSIGSRVIVGAQSGVHQDIPDGQHVLGSPAVPDKQAKRQMIAIQRLPELLRRVSRIEQQLGLGGAVPRQHDPGSSGAPAG